MLRWMSVPVLLAIATAASAGLVRGQATFPLPPPLPSPSPVTEDMYGMKVTDPYRYFENMKDPVVAAFFKDQNQYARAVLDRLGAPRQRLFERIKTLDNAGVSVSDVTFDGPYYFYEKLKPGENSEKLYARARAGGPERLLVDPEKLAGAGKHYTINYFLPSLDGQRVAYGISEGGSEASVIHVVDVRTGANSSRCDRPRVLRRRDELVARQ